MSEIYIVSVLYGCCKNICCICSDGYTRMLQVSIQKVSSTSDICCKCFIWTLHMLQWLYTYVAVVIDICCKCIFKMFHLLWTFIGSASRLQMFHK
jgi:hypothetical protein